MERTNKEPSEPRKEELKRSLTFKDLFFLSIGGQGPFISLIAFGTVMIGYAGILAVVSMTIATLIVLLNGVVIYFLSKRFSAGGGYYTYGLYGLSQRMGFETGWMYLVYSLSYGGSLMLGGGYIFNLFTGIPPIYAISIVVVTAGILVISGAKISSRFAEIFAGAEIMLLLIIALYFIYISHFRFYNPFSSLKFNDFSAIWLGALYGLGIPTGYGSITPLAGEAKDPKKSVGRAAVSAILTGGLLATLFFYALGGLNFTGNLTNFLVSRFGLIGQILISVVSISDGILGGISFLTAVSRVIYKMAKDNFLHNSFSLVWNNKPIVAELASILGISLLTIVPTYFEGIYGALEGVGAISGIFNLFIHLSSDVSLVRISSIRVKLRKAGEIVIGVTSILLSAYLLLDTLMDIQPYIVYTFLGWMVLGFFYLEILDITRRSTTNDKNEE